MDLVVLGGALREDPSYPHIGCVDLDDELEFGVRQCEDGDRGEPLLEGLEWLPCLRVPLEPGAWRSESMEGDRPVRNSTNLGLLHLDAPWCHNEAQEGDGALVELTLLRLDKQLIL